MSVQSYLTNCARKAVLSDNEKKSINRSITIINLRIKEYFGMEVKEQVRFGSSTRGTILPRKIDERSDIDYMVVFTDDSLKPQTYLNRLRGFAEKYYTRSEIHQSQPTVVLALNHIQFDLVPALPSIISVIFSGYYQIPAPSSNFEDWTYTNPNSFNKKLTDANMSHNLLLKPLVRLIKYWNATNGYVFNSYELEQLTVDKVCELDFWWNNNNLKTYFYHVINSLSVDFGAAQWKNNKIDKAKSIIKECEEWENNGYAKSAEDTIKSLLPEF